MLPMFKRKSPAEMMRENKRTLARTQRELDRERRTLESQEKKLIQDIKKAAQQNQVGVVKIMAKDLVRTRGYITKFYKMKTQLQAVSLRMQTMRSSAQMGEAMKGVVESMQQMGAAMNVGQMQRIMMEFAKQSEVMDMKQEVLTDTIDDAMEESEDEEEMEAIVGSVLEEIGINVGDLLSEAPTAGLSRQEEGEANELNSKLAALHK